MIVKIHDCTIRTSILTYPDDVIIDLDKCQFCRKKVSKQIFLVEKYGRREIYLPSRYQNVSSLEELKILFDMKGGKDTSNEIAYDPDL